MNENLEQTEKKTFKDFWEKVKNVWNAVINFKWLKFIVVGVIVLVVALVVSINSNTIYFKEGTSKENQVAAFIGVQSESHFYKEADDTGKVKKMWLVIDGYSSKDAYESGSAPVFSETRKMTDEKTVRGAARTYRINYVVKVEEVEEVDINGNKYTETYNRSALEWYNLSVNEQSKIKSYRISTFIELTKLKQEKNVSYLVLSFQLNETEKEHYRNIEIE